MVAAPEAEARQQAMHGGAGRPKGPEPRARAAGAPGGPESASSGAPAARGPEREPRPGAGMYSNARKLAAGILTIAQMLVAMASQAASAAAAGIDGFVAHKIESARRRGLEGTRVHIEQQQLQRLQLLGWLSSHLSSAAAFIASGAGDAYTVLFRFAWKAAAQMAGPWVAALREQAGHSAAQGSKQAMLVRALTLADTEAAALELIASALVVGYAQVYDAFEAAARDVFRTASGAFQNYIGQSYGDELEAVAKEATLIASHLFVLTTSWARLLGRAFISRPAQRRARELLAREVPAVQLGPDPTRAAA